MTHKNDKHEKITFVKNGKMTNMTFHVGQKNDKLDRNDKDDHHCCQ